MAPSDEVATDLREPTGRDRGRIGYRDRGGLASDGWNGNEVDVPVCPHDGAGAIGREYHLVGCRGAAGTGSGRRGHLHLNPDICAVHAHGEQTFAAGPHVHPLRIGPHVWRVAPLLGLPAAYPGDPFRVAPVRGKPHVLELGGRTVAAEVLEGPHAMHLRSANGHESGAVRGVGDLVVERGAGGQSLRIAPVRTNAPYVTADRVVPRHVGDPASIR